MTKTPLKTMKIRLTDTQVKVLRRESNGFVWAARKSTMAALVRLGIANSADGCTAGHLTVVGTGLAASVRNSAWDRRTYDIVTPESAAQWEAEVAEAADAAKTPKKITADVEHLAEDTTVPATVFDPELTYYADGTRVRMTWSGGTKEGTTFGRYIGAGPYAFQAVRWDDGSEDGVAPHTLTRVDVEEAERNAKPGNADWRTLGTVETTEKERGWARRELAASRVEAANAGHLVWRRNDRTGVWESQDGRWEVCPAHSPSGRGGSVIRPSYWVVKDGAGLVDTFDRQALADAWEACRGRSVSHPAPVPAR